MVGSHPKPGGRWNSPALRAQTLDRIDALATIETLPALAASLHDAFAVFGIDHFIIAGLPNPDERFEKVVILNHWSAAWSDLYSKEQFIKDDPVVHYCRRSSMPFEWTEAPFDPAREPRALQVMNLASDFGLKRGFSIPVHGPNGYEACFSVSGARPEFNRNTKASIHLIALYAFERVLRLAPCRTTANPLTAREREVLTWAAAGKTHADIAEVLSVTERTVTAHMVDATHKLGAANKTHAVARAMQAKFINV